MSSIPHTHAAVLAWHFRAGPASLGVSAIDAVPGSAPPCAAEAAVVLDLAGELLDALAAAGLTPADPWHWVAQPAGPAPGAQASWRGAQAEAQLWLPWGVLRALAEAPDVPGLQWHATPAECVLAHWQLAADELAALEPGGLLLLEQPVGDALRARGEATPGDRGQQLVARWEQPLPADVVLGWTGMRPALPVACQLIDAARPDAVLARGRLVPWGSGHALRIDSL